MDPILTNTFFSYGYPPILLSLTYNIKHSLQFHQISSHPSHNLYLCSSRSSSDSFYTKFSARELVHTKSSIHFSPPTIFSTFYTPPKQVCTLIISFSAPYFISPHSIFHHPSFPLTLPLPHLSLRFTRRLFSHCLRFVFPLDRFSLQCPVRRSIPPPSIFPLLFFSFLLSQSLFLPFCRLFFVTSPPINILSSHSLPRTDPSHFTIFTKFYFTLNSFSLLHFSARCLLSLFFFPLDILRPYEVTFAVSHRLSSFIRPI